MVPLYRQRESLFSPRPRAGCGIGADGVVRQADAARRVLAKDGRRRARPLRRRVKVRRFRRGETASRPIPGGVGRRLVANRGNLQPLFGGLNETGGGGGYFTPLAGRRRREFYSG